MKAEQLLNPVNLVTVILINRNHGHTLAQSVESYLVQSGIDLKILCIDGASTDKSLEILGRFPEVGVYSEPDKSGSDALVKGIKLTKSKYLMIATSNDLLVDSKFIRVAVNLMEKDNSLSCVFGKVLSMTSDGMIGTDIFPYISNYFGDPTKNFLLWLKQGASFHECASVFRTDTVNDCLPNIDSFIGEIQNLKEDLTLRLRYEFYSRGHKAQFVNLSAVAVRDHLDRTSITQRQHIKKHFDVYNFQLTQFRRRFLLNSHFNFKDTSNFRSLPLGRKDRTVSCIHIFFIETRRILGTIKRFVFSH